MKHTKKLLALLLSLLLVFSLAACFNEPEEPSENGAADGGADDGSAALDPLWDSALYKENTTLGTGEKTVTLTVSAKGKDVVFTILTNADNMRDALLAVGLIDGEQQGIGYLISHVNGMRADYTLDGAYWGFFQGGEYMMTGVDSTPVAGEEAFELVYTKA